MNTATRLFFLLLIGCYGFGTQAQEAATLRIVEASVEYTDAGAYDKAIEVLKTHLEATGTQKEVDAALLYHKIAVNLYYDFASEAALTYVTKALDLRTQSLGKNHQASQKSLFLRYAIYRDLGQLEQALEDLERNIEYLKTTGDTAVLIDRYNEMGITHLLLNNYYECIFYWEKVNDYRTQNLALSDPEIYQIKDQLATVYKDIQQYDKALQLFEAAISFYEQNQPVLHADLCIAYNNLALTYDLVGENSIAQDYFQKAVIHCQKAADKINLLEAYTNQIANYTKLKKFAAAQIAFDRGRELSEEMSAKVDEASLYNNLGQLEQAKGKLKLAVQHYDRAVELLVPDLNGRVTSELPNPQRHYIQFKADLLLPLSNKASVLTSQNKLSDALAIYESIDQLLTSIRMDYKGGNAKFFLLQKTTSYYEQAIELALNIYEKTKQPSYLEKAYQFNAKNKAIVLIDALKDQSAKSFAGLPTAILQEERDWKRRIHGVETLLYEAQSNTTADVQKYRDSLFQTKQGYKNFITALERDYPNYYELKYTFDEPPSISNIQSKLTKNTLLLEYFLGAEKAYLFTITRDDFNVHEIEDTPALMRDIQVINDFLRTPTATSEAKEHYLKLAHQMYQTLVAPALKDAATTRQLLIIPDGSLTQLAFESLLYEPSSELQNTTPFLLEKYAISYLYSSSFLGNTSVSEYSTALFGGFGIEYDEATLESIANKMKIPTRGATNNLRSMGKL
ncbi:MAG: tetratricopeptide repeat protein, partial [Bacteroidota bacterium]